MNLNKKVFFKALLSVAFLGIVSMTYFNTNHYISNQDWKYADGFTIGDWLSKNTFAINERVIHSNRGKAKIIFCFGFLLIVNDIETKEKGYYSNKS